MCYRANHKKRFRVLLLAGVVGAIALACGPAVARADLAVTFDLSQAQMVYTAGTKTLNVTESSASTFNVNLEEMMTTSVQDRAVINGSDPFDFQLVLNLTDLLGVDKWSATGTLTFTDTNTASNAVMANFKSSSIASVIGAGGFLQIMGYLSTPSGQDSILINRGDEPWKFMGQASSTPGDENADGVLGQITRYQRAAQDNGVLLTLKVGIQDLSLDTLFGAANRTLQGGEVKGSIVPAPAAVMLGLVGLAAVGWYMRRLA